MFIFGCTLVLKTANYKTSSWGWLMTEACNHYDISTYFCLLNFFPRLHIASSYISFNEETASFIADNSAVTSKGTIMELGHNVFVKRTYLVLFLRI